MSSTIQVRVDDELKTQVDQLFKDLGIDTTTAIRIFLTQALINNGFPFEIKRNPSNPYLPLTEEQLLQKLESARKDQELGNYRLANHVVSDLESKYGL